MTMQQRFIKHCHEQRPTMIRNSIKKYGRENHTIELINTHDTAADAKLNECYLIAVYETNRRKHPNGNGLNLTDGGEGVNGYKFSNELKLELKKNKMAWYSDRHNKLVFQFNQNGEFITEHRSAKAAAEFIGAHGADISKCCRGIVRTVKGFVFSYDKTTSGARCKQKGESPLKKPVVVIHPSGEHTICQSIAEAQSIIGSSRGNVLKSMRTMKPIKGFIVRLHDQEHLLEPQSRHTEHPS